MAKTEKKKESKEGIVLKNYHLEPLSRWLNLPLHGEQSRVRTRTLRVIAPLMDDKETERLKIATECADKDEKGVAIMENEGRNFKFSGDASERFFKGYNDLQNADVTLDMTETLKKDLPVLRTIIKNFNPPAGFSGEDGEFYEQVCTAFGIE